MTIPRIYTKATNVELTAQHEHVILERLAPLARLLLQEEQATITVNIRRSDTEGGETFFVMVKVATSSGNHVAAAEKPHLGRALSAAREMLRRSISRGPSVVHATGLEQPDAMLREYLSTERAL